MSLKNHLLLLLMSFITWATFVLIGLPDYYQSWHFVTKILICVAVTLFYFPFTVFLLKKFANRKDLRNSLWLAFYLTLPLFLYDYIYIVLLGGDDLTFVFRYWYLSFFYFSFWIQFPFVAYWMNRTRSK